MQQKGRRVRTVAQRIQRLTDWHAAWAGTGKTVERALLEGYLRATERTGGADRIGARERLEVLGEGEHHEWGASIEPGQVWTLAGLMHRTLGEGETARERADRADDGFGATASEGKLLWEAWTRSWANGETEKLDERRTRAGARWWGSPEAEADARSFVRWTQRTPRRVAKCAKVLRAKIDGDASYQGTMPGLGKTAAQGYAQRTLHLAGAPATGGSKRRPSRLLSELGARERRGALKCMEALAYAATAAQRLDPEGAGMMAGAFASSVADRLAWGDGEKEKHGGRGEEDDARGQARRAPELPKAEEHMRAREERWAHRASGPRTARETAQIIERAEALGPSAEAERAIEQAIERWSDDAELPRLKAKMALARGLTITAAESAREAHRKAGADAEAQGRIRATLDSGLKRHDEEAEGLATLAAHGVDTDGTATMAAVREEMVEAKHARPRGERRRDPVARDDRHGVRNEAKESSAAETAAKRFAGEAQRLGRQGDTWVTDCAGPGGEQLRLHVRPAKDRANGWLFITATARHGHKATTAQALRAFIEEQGFEVDPQEDPFGGLRFHIRPR